MSSFVEIDKGWDALISNIGRIDRDEPSRTVGVHKDKVDEEDGFIAMRAAKNEFGEEGVPARSFIRSTFDEKEIDWTMLMGRFLAKSFLSSPDRLLQLVAARAVTDVRASIATAAPRNAPATIARKGFDQPLVETGDLFQSIDQEIG